MNKYKSYKLYAKIKGKNGENYTYDEAKNDDTKRPFLLMDAELIEKLDQMTSYYESYDDLLDSYPEEVFGKPEIMYDPVIYVDKHLTNREKSYYIFDIVFREDSIELKNYDNIKNWLLDYLNSNPKDVEKFRGINDIYNNMKKKYPWMSEESLIHNTVEKYFVDNNYKRYREAYFKLKSLDRKKENINEKHR